MKQILVIPKQEKISDYIYLAGQYNLGFEYNDFFMPDILNDENKCEKIVQAYKLESLPDYTTVHGAFFDVIPFSADARIREISRSRIEQSVKVAKDIGAKAVVFHTNYNPCLNSDEYVSEWIKTNAAYWGSVLDRHSDINIYLENMFDATPDILEQLSEQLDKYSNYGVCLDYAHASLSKLAPSEWARKLGRFVKHIHINDNDGISDLHLPWGNGVIDRKQFYEDYESYMKGASVLVEVSDLEKTVSSIKILKEEGFLD